MLSILLLAPALAVLPLQDGTIAPDRAAFIELVRCAGVHQASVAVLRTDSDAVPGEAEAAAAVAVGFQHLAYLQAAPLLIERPQTDAAIAEATEIAAYPARIARTLARLQLAREQLATQRQACAALLERISGTS